MNKEPQADEHGNLGLRVIVYYKNGGKQIFRNITEIHYCYTNGSSIRTDRVAFETNIHNTGFTEYKDDILEFEALMETEIYHDAVESYTRHAN